ncbi:uncharacterized protein JCM6883_003199 [Sporobolomyces salmoneus]|uniref:uncharacterized protein n=1 Tax=Sporobolomyces salmoneus TaxID=183962 RepID=UPI0031753B3F
MRWLLCFSLLIALLLLINPVDASKKKKSKVPRTFCPANEFACPISGSTTYHDAVKQHMTGNGTVQGIMAGSGGCE